MAKTSGASAPINTPAVEPNASTAPAEPKLRVAGMEAATPVAEGASQWSETSVVFNDDGHGWPTEEEAKVEFRQRSLDKNKWAVAVSPLGIQDGYVLMTYKLILDIKAKSEAEHRAVVTNTKIPQKYYRISFGSSADASKPDQVAQPIICNGMIFVAYLGKTAIAPEWVLEVLQNHIVDNLRPEINKFENEAITAQGKKSRVNYSVLGESTEAEFMAYREKNKERFGAYQATISKDQQKQVVMI